MSKETTKIIIDELAGSIDIPDTAYEKADARYTDLGEWFMRPEAHCAKYDPHIYPQGSFRLGTVVRAAEYDLDFGCRLREGINKDTHSQQQLKQLVRLDLEEYRRARGIEQQLEEKTRCWRLKYKDEMEFHMDGVPSIPEVQQRRQLLQESMVKAGADQFLAEQVVKHAGAITDNRLANYSVVSPNWRVSNSEGYALWFQARMKLAPQLLEDRAFQAKAASIDELPARRWKSPLQQCVQILKCHRDIMFADNPESKPISVILTTLAGEAYEGEQEIPAALESILTRMGALVRPTRPRVPNPVNPVEDFADKWYDPKYAHLELEQSFKDWLEQAQRDFRLVAESNDPEFISEQAMTKFGAAVNAASLKQILRPIAPVVVTQPKTHAISGTPAQPWRRS